MEMGRGGVFPCEGDVFERAYRWEIDPIADNGGGVAAVSAEHYVYAYSPPRSDKFLWWTKVRISPRLLHFRNDSFMTASY